jgi:hypothetical protein
MPVGRYGAFVGVGEGCGGRVIVAQGGASSVSPPQGPKT